MKSVITKYVKIIDTAQMCKYNGAQREALIRSESI